MSRINQALHQMKLQDWALKIKDQASSGLLVSEWCAQNHVTRYQFHYWKRLVKEAAIEQMLRTPAFPVAQPLQVVQHPRVMSLHIPPFPSK